MSGWFSEQVLELSCHQWDSWSSCSDGQCPSRPVTHSGGPSLVLSLAGSVLSSDLILHGGVAVTAWAWCRQVCSDRAVLLASLLARAPTLTRRCSSGSVCPRPFPVP